MYGTSAEIQTGKDSRELTFDQLQKPCDESYFSMVRGSIPRIHGW